MGSVPVVVLWGSCPTPCASRWPRSQVAPADHLTFALCAIAVVLCSNSSKKPLGPWRPTFTLETPVGGKQPPQGSQGASPMMGHHEGSLAARFSAAP